MMKLSACILTKNEEKNIRFCLESLKDVADEITLVDTGSNDRTLEIAAEYHAEIYSYIWSDDFSAARNFAIEKSSGDWIIFLDADEYFSDETKANIKGVIARYADKYDTYRVKIINVDCDKQNEIQDYFYKVRIFRNDPNLRYEGEIHENLVELTGAKDRFYMVGEEELTIYHTGYSSGRFQEKCERDLRLLLKQLNGTERDRYWFAHLADVYYGLKQYEEAVLYAKKAIALSPKDLFCGSRRYRVLFNSMRNLHADTKELEQILDEAIENYADLPDFYFEKAIFYYESSDYDAALELLLEADSFYESYSGTEVTRFEQDLIRAYTIIAEIYEMKQMYVEATIYNRKVLLLDKNNKKCFRALYYLLLHENETEVIAFFNHIYDKNDVSDLTFLIEEISEIAKGRILHYYINAKKNLLQDESVDIDQILALHKFEYIEKKVNEDLQERVRNQAAFYILRRESNLQSMCMRNLPISYQRVIWRYYKVGEVVLGEDDFFAYNEIFSVLLSTTRKDTIDLYAQCVLDFRMQYILQIAAILYNECYYQEALTLYMHSRQHLNGKDLDMLYENIGDCYYKLNMDEDAERYFLYIESRNSRVECFLKWIKERRQVIERDLKS